MMGLFLRCPKKTNLQPGIFFALLCFLCAFSLGWGSLHTQLARLVLFFCRSTYVNETRHRSHECEARRAHAPWRNGRSRSQLPVRCVRRPEEVARAEQWSFGSRVVLRAAGIKTSRSERRRNSCWAGNMDEVMWHLRSFLLAYPRSSEIFNDPLSDGDDFHCKTFGTSCSVTVCLFRESVTGTCTRTPSATAQRLCKLSGTLGFSGYSRYVVELF